MSVLADRCAALGATLERLRDLEVPFAQVAATVADAIRSGGTVLVAGNGGSAAEAQHLSAEMVGRLHPDRERRALPAVALQADTSILTAVGNDYGFDRVFARQVEALGRPGDVLIVLSTSGRSADLVAAVDVAGERGITTVGLLGAGPSPLHERCALTLAVPVDARSVQAVQECHLVLVHALVEQVEDLLGVV